MAMKIITIKVINKKDIIHRTFTGKIMITLNDFETAQKRITPYVAHSLLVYSNWLSQELKAEVYLKLECLQPGRSFKIRGATNTLLAQSSLPKMVITASEGNHGIGVTIACNQLNIPCSVVLPTSAYKYRITLLKSLGAKVILNGDSFDDASKHAIELASNSGALYIHAFADRDVMIGQGTIALELMQEQALKDLDIIMVSTGGGGLLSGISLALEAMGKSDDIQIYSAETKGADCIALSLQQKKLVELPAITSIAKSLGARKSTPFIFNTLQRLINKSFVVEDSQAVEALLQFLDNEKLLIEPATSCIIAAALANRKLFENQKVVFIICGGNVTLAEIDQWKAEFLS